MVYLSYGKKLRLMMRVSGSDPIAMPVAWRRKRLPRLLMPWRFPATPCLTLPDAVKRKRFLAPLLVFILGIFIPFQRVTIGGRGNALWARPPKKGAYTDRSRPVQAQHRTAKRLWLGRFCRVLSRSSSHMPQSSKQAHGPLQGIKVVSCSTAQAGTLPYMLMADLGADVIKIETPQGGDPSRGMTLLPGMGSTFFETNNRGVKSVRLDPKTPEGKAILHRLVAEADIFGQNFRPRAAEQNALGWEELRNGNPKPLYLSISR